MLARQHTVTSGELACRLPTTLAKYLGQGSLIRHHQIALPGSETDHRFEEASELPEQAGVQPELSPLIISTKERLETPQPESLPELDDPFAPQPIKEDLSPIPSLPPPPPCSPTPPPPNHQHHHHRIRQ